jgi:hypothetical protein
MEEKQEAPELPSVLTKAQEQRIREIFREELRSATKEDREAHEGFVD